MKKIPALLLSLVLLITSCGTTTIIGTSSWHDIYVDKVCLGKGTVKITRMGIPKTIKVEERAGNKVIASATGKRKFDFVTFVLGMYTYGPGLLIGWRYPKTIVLHPDYTMGWDEQDNPWVNPSSAWNK